MANVRKLAVVGAVAVAAALAACSGSMGGGTSTLPGAPQPGSSAGTNSVAVAKPSPTPTTAANVVTIGETSAQPLPPVAGWGGSITFPQPIGSPAPSASGSPAPAASPTPVSISVAISSSLVAPSDVPAFPGGGKGGPSNGLLFLRLLTTNDVNFAQYPTLAVDVPNTVAGLYAGRPFRLAVFDPSTKTKAFRVDVAQGVVQGPAASTPMPTPTPTASPSPGTTPGAITLTPPPPVALAAGNLPAVHVLFGTPAQPLTLKSNEGFVIAVYAAAPSPKPSPSPKPTPTPKATPTPAAMPSPVTSATASPSAAPSPTASISTR